LKKIKEIVLVLMNPVAERGSVVNVLPITGEWVNYLAVYFLLRWRELTIVLLENLSKHTNDSKK